MYPWGPKFAQNWSISYGFQDKQHFPFPPKFKMVAENQKSLNFLEVLGVVPCTLGVQNLPEIGLCLAVFEIIIFQFRQNSRWRPKIRKV